MGQLQKSIDLISNNLANVDTTGYKSRGASFSSLLVQQINNQPNAKAEVGRITPNGIRVGNGAAIGTTQMNMTMGSMKDTGRALDLALNEPQLFFSVQGQDAFGKPLTQYTRDGAFYLSPEKGNSTTLDLVNKSGQYILGQNGSRIQIPANYSKITIDGSGQISASLPNGTVTSAGQLNVVSIKRPQLLEGVGNNQFILPNLANLGLKPTDVLGTPATTTAFVKQGALESSNVNMTDDMTNLINVQRSYELNAKAISISDQMMSLVNSIR